MTDYERVMIYAGISVALTGGPYLMPRLFAIAFCIAAVGYLVKDVRAEWKKLKGRQNNRRTSE